MPDSERVADPFRRGHVVWHDGLFRSSGRPWLVLSDEDHPFQGEEYLVAGLTTTEREDAICLDESDWNVGGLPRTSYVSPCFLTTLKGSGIDRGIGQLTSGTVSEITDEVVGYLR